MIWKTHLAIGLAVALFFSTHVNDPLLFIPLVLVSSILPTLLSLFSSKGRKQFSNPTHTGSNSRGFVHSYTFCILLLIAVVFFYPVAGLPFFLGYSFHLFADSFTPQGIRPFWPFKGVSKGFVTTGGKIDKVLFYTFVFIDLVLIVTIAYGLL